MGFDYYGQSNTKQIHGWSTNNSQDFSGLKTLTADPDSMPGKVSFDNWIGSKECDISKTWIIKWLTL